MKTLIKNIKELVQVQEGDPTVVRGHDMKSLTSLQNAYLVFEDGIIKEVGIMDEVPEHADVVINAQDKYALPCWCDSHTHLVYGKSREEEFIDRIKGATYEEIARKGGGILNSAKAHQDISEEELLEISLDRINEIKMLGTGAVEIKSGYGLTVASEMKVLRVIKKLKALTPVTIRATFLGAHAIPAEFKNKRDKYIDLVIQEMLPQVREEGLADYCDVFCEDGFFTVDETDKILQAASDIGIQAKVHANELGYSGGVQVGVKNKAVSVDHLEFTGNDEIEALLDSETMPTLLPSTAFFLGLEYAPARRIIDSGLPVALASDYNPGTSPSGRMAFIMSLACMKMNMSPEEAINAATINGAFAMGVQEESGSLIPGKKANIILTKKIPSLAYIPYAFGSDLIESVIINGQVQ